MGQDKAPSSPGAAPSAPPALLTLTPRCPAPGPASSPSVLRAPPAPFNRSLPAPVGPAQSHGPFPARPPSPRERRVEGSCARLQPWGGAPSSGNRQGIILLTYKSNNPSFVHLYSVSRLLPPPCPRPPAPAPYARGSARSSSAPRDSSSRFSSVLASEFRLLWAPMYSVAYTGLVKLVGWGGSG